MQNERVLVAASESRTAARAAQRVLAAGGQAIVVRSVAEASTIAGVFDRGVFAFDLSDGSGVVLAARLMLESRLSEVEFCHPADELGAPGDHPAEMRSTTSRAIDAAGPKSSAA